MGTNNFHFLKCNALSLLFFLLLQPREVAADFQADHTVADQDGDGIPDIVEAVIDPSTNKPVDTDGDGKADFLDVDSDNDGMSDRVESSRMNDINSILAAGGTWTPRDSDGDGIPDHLDLDSDNDGIMDIIEHSINPT